MQFFFCLSANSASSRLENTWGSRGDQHLGRGGISPKLPPDIAWLLASLFSVGYPSSSPPPLNSIGFISEVKPLGRQDRREMDYCRRKCLIDGDSHSAS